MKKMKFVLLLIVFFVSCSEGDKNGKIPGDLQPISIKEGEIKKITEEDVINSIHFVRLATANDYLIDKIQQIERYGDNFYILDGKENLFVFDAYGKFVRKIGRKGPGPEEYIGNHMFYIHPTKQYISIFSLTTNTVVRYDLKGNYLERLPLTLKSNVLLSGRCYLLGKNNLLLECSNSRKFAPYQYLCLDEETLTEKKYFFPWAALGEYSESLGFYNINNNVGKDFYAISHCNDTIYKFENEIFIPQFILESGLKHPTPYVVKEYAPYKFIDEANKRLNQNGYSMGINRLFSTEKLFCLEYWGLGYYDLIFWCKNKQEGYLYRLLESDNPLLHVYNELYCADEKYLIRYFPVEMFLVAEKEIRVSNHREIPELYKNLKEDDNPVILLYNYDKLLSRFK